MITTAQRSTVERMVRTLQDSAVLLRRMSAQAEASGNEFTAAALVAILAETQWQPIATAPRDGTEILVLRGGRQYVARWQPQWRCWGVSVAEPDGRESPFSDISEREFGAMTIYEGPTHWMELPDLPAPPEKDE